MSDYNLDALGWYQFERLVQALLRAGFGARLEAWGGSKDLGRDAYAEGPLRFPDPAMDSIGPFVFQAKFVSGASAPGASVAGVVLKAVRAERERIKARLATRVWREPRYYTLVTNAPLTPKLRADVATTLQAVMPTATITAWGDTDVAASLDAFPRIRTSYPQILGLRDLESLLDKVVAPEVRKRSSLALKATTRLAEVYVPTKAYSETLRSLNDHGFAVLTGPPEVGKTATARIVALARYTTGWQAFETKRPEEILKVFDEDAQQIFVADDAFGSTEYRPDLANDWADNLEHLVEMTDANHAIVWTSRPGPLKEALRRMRRQGTAEHFPEPSQVQIDASELSVPEKAQMLYRHAKAAQLDDAARDVVRRAARRIVSSPYFTPLRVQRFVQEDLQPIAHKPEAEQAALIARAVEIGIREPTDTLRQSFNMLSDDHRAILLAMLNAADTPVRMSALSASVEAILGRPPERPIRDLVDDLDEHFLTIDEDA